MLQLLTSVLASSQSDHYQNSHTTPVDASTSDSDWIQATIAAASKDTRRQPWKSTFGTPVGSRIDDDEQDLVTVKGSSGEPLDPLCPFRTQGSSLAG